jgi:hypothetical protein
MTIAFEILGEMRAVETIAAGPGVYTFDTIWSAHTAGAVGEK